MRAIIADEVDELTTDPALNGGGFDIEAGERIRQGEKINCDRMVLDRVIATAEGWRFNREGIDQVKNAIFRKEADA